MSGTPEHLARVLTDYAEQYVPDGYRDDDGVWHDGPHLIEFRAALAELQALAEAGQRLRDEHERWRGGLEIIAAGESRHFHVYAQNLLDGFHPYDTARQFPLAAAAPPPADRLVDPDGIAAWNAEAEEGVRRLENKRPSA